MLGRFFEKFPGATSTMTADSVWMVSPGLAIEEGRRVVSTKDDQPSAATRYTLVMIKQQGEWKIASGREVEDDDSLSPHDRLKPLAWLVGDWVDEGSDAVVQISCRWSDDKNYLLVDFNAKVQGKPALKSSQRIGWDPLTREGQVLGLRLRRRPRRGALVPGREPLGDQVHRGPARRADRLRDDRAGAAGQGLLSHEGFRSDSRQDGGAGFRAEDRPQAAGAGEVNRAKPRKSEARRRTS